VPDDPKHTAEKLVRHLTGAYWTIWCSCGEKIHGSDPILAHRNHDDHVASTQYEEIS
jgi:hypothetical protein